ncbi:kinesin-like protein KIN-7N [Telopea speciosissima]|uniref:kinesin-like protein KIN-7N n=1 Tax=Telopea speciosissima TaxID=54955 RepID=UPI001CC3BE89|nr:kinesin-like protein KIN-7N [Telopea speciosissima]
MEKICVAVRVRPAVSQEVPNGTFWKVEDNRISLHRPLGTPVSGASYAFDHVFDENCTNVKVYDLLAKDIIRSAVEGFNGTAFAYGQTSSGKTFTMNGSENDPGIIHLAVKDIFRNIQMQTDREFLVRVSYMEIYNEEINDLFAPENQKLQIHESLERGIFVSGLREEIVNNAEQLLKLIELGQANQHFGETNMNARSSRSHTIFRMVIESKGTDSISSGDYSSSDAIRVSVLNLVDLAGSERIAKTGAGGVRLKEGKHINKSLMILGNVIYKLSDGGKQRGHIPYRDSKLTRILQPALGGNAKTSIICTVAPEEVHIEETKGTLQFASRAKRITNCAQVNEILTDAALLKRQKLEIEELRKKLQGSRLEVLEQEMLKLRNEMLKYEKEREKLALELEDERRSHKERDRCISEQQMKIDNLSSFVTCSEIASNSAQSSSEHSVPHSGLDLENWGKFSITQSFKEEENHRRISADAFRTPCFKATPNAFVVKRSNYSRLPDSSPVPDNFCDVADEDMWLKLNQGFTTDLDSLQITPSRKPQSLPSSAVSPGYSIDYYKEEVQNLKRKLKHAIDEKNELERNHAKQLLVNDQLMREMSELQQESLLIQEIPQKMCESVANCRDIYKDVLSIMQSFVADEKSMAAELLSSTREIGITLFSTLETHFGMATGGYEVATGESSLTREQQKVLLECLSNTITNLASSETPNVEHKYWGTAACISKYEVAASLQLLKCHSSFLIFFIVILAIFVYFLGLMFL